MIKHLIALAAVAAVAAPAHALTVTQWNFNSATPDAATGTGTILPAIGSGTASLLGVTAGFSSGDANGGSSDPAIGDDSGWQTTGYPAVSAGNKTEGTQYLVSTVGFEQIVISYDLRHSNTSSRYEALQYTLDGGASFIDATTFDGNAGDTWFNRSFSLNGVAGVDDNAGFGFRIVASFAPGTNAYAASSSTYAGTGTWRFDMVTVSGVAAPIPEPGTYALLLAGLCAVGFVANRRRI